MNPFAASYAVREIAKYMRERKKKRNREKRMQIQQMETSII